jgi:hypothetical protein
MPVEQVGGNTITIKKRDVFGLFFRRQGLQVKGESPIDSLNVSITLKGVADVPESGSCSNCKKLNVMGPTSFGVNPPPTFQAVDYDVKGTEAGQSFEFTGRELFS